MRKYISRISENKLILFIFLLFLVRQFFSLVDINFISSSEKLINQIGYIAFFAFLIPLSLAVIFYLPTIVVIEIIITIKIIKKAYRPILVRYINENIILYKTRVLLRHRHKEYCVYRC